MTPTQTQQATPGTDYCEAEHPDAHLGCYGSGDHTGKHHGYYHDYHPYKEKGWAERFEWTTDPVLTTPVFTTLPDVAFDNFTAAEQAGLDGALAIANDGLHPVLFSTRELAELYSILSSKYDISAVYLEKVGTALRGAL